MSMEIEKIYEEYEDYEADNKNEIVKGLNILAKYHEDISFNPAHDEIFAGFPNMENVMTEVDVRAMFDLNWMWSDGSFSKFC